MVDHRCCNFIGDGCLIGVGLLYTLLIVPKHVLVLVMPQKSLHSCSEKTDKFNLGLEDFAYALQNVIVNEGPIVRELPTQKKEETKVGHMGHF